MAISSKVVALFESPVELSSLASEDAVVNIYERCRASQLGSQRCENLQPNISREKIISTTYRHPRADRRPDRAPMTS